MNLYRHPLEVRAFFINVERNGGSVSQGTLTALSAFVNRLKRTSIWAKLDEIYPLCGRGIASACVKLKYLDAPFLTSHNFTDEDFEEWGPSAGLTPDGATKYLDTNLPATSLRDDAHLCYIEQQPAIDSGARTAIGVTNGTLEWSIGASDTFSNRIDILGDPAAPAIIAGGYNDWTSLYLANRQSPTSLQFYKRTHLKITNATPSATGPKPSLNLFVCARNSSGVADQYWKNRLRFTSIGQALTSDEVPTYYHVIQQFQDALGRAV